MNEITEQIIDELEAEIAELKETIAHLTQALEITKEQREPYCHIVRK